MAKRYICRLFFVELPDGKIQVTYDDPSAHLIAKPVDLIGPSPLQVPERPQTQKEHDSWLLRLIPPNGHYTMRISASRALDLPPIEEEDVFDTDGVEIKADLERYQRDGQRTTALVVVRNTGGAPVRELSVHWECENEAAQPMQVGNVKAMEVGGTISLLRSNSFAGTLGVGESTCFLLDDRLVDSILSQIAALSPERYGISIRSGEAEVLRLPGSVVGKFLEELEEGA